MGNVVIVAFAERSIQICEISFVGLNFLQQDCPLQLHYNCVGWRAWEATAFAPMHCITNATLTRDNEIL